MSDEDPMATKLLEEFAQGAAERSGLPDAVRAEAKLELLSHLYDLARTKAQEGGRAAPGQDDARAAIADAGDVDAAFFAPHRARLGRAPFGPRVVAYVIDFALLMLILGVVFATVGEFAHSVLRDSPSRCHFDIEDPLPLVGSDVYCSNALPGFALFLGVVAFLVDVLQYALVVMAFVVFEQTVGQTPGKMAMRLRVVSQSGAPLTRRQAVLRNLTKGFPPFALVDFVLGAMASRDAHETISDRLVKTCVVREVR